MKKLAMVLVLVMGAACTSTSPPWQAYGGDGQRTLTSRRPGPAQPRLLWAVDLDAHLPGHPVVDQEGNIYVPHSGGSVTKISAKGKQEWRFDSWLSGPGQIPPHLVLLPGGRLAISTLGAQQQTMVLTTAGQPVAGKTWFPWPAAVSPAVTPTGYAVVCHQYAIGSDTVGLRIYGVTRDGRTVWEREYYLPQAAYTASPPLVREDGTAIVFIDHNRGDNLLLALDPKGQLLWQTEFAPVDSKGVALALAATGGKIFLGTARVEDIHTLHSPGWIYAIGSRGEILWRVEAGQRVVQIMAGPQTVVANVLRSRLLALDLAGHVRWEYPLAGWESNGVMDSRGNVYMVGVKQGTVWLRAVDSRGRDRWEFNTAQPAGSVSFAALWGGVLYVTTDGGLLLAIGG